MSKSIPVKFQSWSSPVSNHQKRIPTPCTEETPFFLRCFFARLTFLHFKSKLGKIWEFAFFVKMIGPFEGAINASEVPSHKHRWHPQAACPSRLPAVWQQDCHRSPAAPEFRGAMDFDPNCSCVSTSGVVSLRRGIRNSSMDTWNLGTPCSLDPGILEPCRPGILKPENLHL